MERSNQENVANASRWAAGFNCVIAIIAFIRILDIDKTDWEWMHHLGASVLFIIIFLLFQLGLQEFRRAVLQDRVVKIMEINK